MNKVNYHHGRRSIVIWILCISFGAAPLAMPTTWASPAKQAYLKASNTGSNDFSKFSVAVSGGTMVVGAYGHASSSGAAYVFTSLGIGPQLALVPDDGGGYFIRFNGAPDVT